MDWLFDGTTGTFDVNGDGRSRTYFAEKALENQGAAFARRVRIEPSGWHFGGSSAGLIPSLSELRYLLGLDDAQGRALGLPRSGKGRS
jgi:hypothetical protein